MKKNETRNPLKERKLSNVSGILGAPKLVGPPKSLVERVKLVDVEVDLEKAKAELTKVVYRFINRS